MGNTTAPATREGRSFFWLLSWLESLLTIEARKDNPRRMPFNMAICGDRREQPTCNGYDACIIYYAIF